jgi:hypothetical protein
MLVGFLGERAQFAWWPTAFYEASSRLFLEPVFSKTSRLAQYHGVLEAARRLHDEHLSVGSYHLFRLPEEVEQDLHAIVQSSDGRRTRQPGTTKQRGCAGCVEAIGRDERHVQRGPNGGRKHQGSRFRHPEGHRGSLPIGVHAERQNVSVSGGLIVADNKPYTTQLQAGLGLVNETKTLLDLWSPGMSANQLHQVALESGRFPTVTARRLRNIVVECFAPRYSGGRWRASRTPQATVGNDFHC